MNTNYPWQWNGMTQLKEYMMSMLCGWWSNQQWHHFGCLDLWSRKRSSMSLNMAKSAVEAALKSSTNTNVQKVWVEVKGSEVTLTGVVDTLYERNLATHFAWNTPGVRKVVDNISLA